MGSDTYRQVAQRMRQALEEKNMTLAEAARQMKKPSGTLSKWLSGGPNGQMPRPAALESYAQVVGKPVRWFYGEEDGLEPQDIGEAVKAALIRFLAAAAAGEDLGDLLEKEYGPLSPSERALWHLGSAQVIQEGLQKDLGLSYELLTDQERREVIGQVAQWLVGRLHSPNGSRHQ